MLIARSAADVERAGEEGKRAVIIDFQNTVAFGDDLDRIPLFYGLGLRMVQLTYNLQNLAADGCTETYQGGLTYRPGNGRAAQRPEHSHDVSHCSEKTGWDAMDVSSAPVIVSHSSSKVVAEHDRGKSDELAKSIADQGGYFGVVVIPVSIRDTPERPSLISCARSSIWSTFAASITWELERTRPHFGIVHQLAGRVSRLDGFHYLET
ncbi:MAG: membrane dipeptidase [Thermomicrobiales bacterium]